MAEIIIYVADPSLVEVRSGMPPIDQSAEVAALQAQVSQLAAENAALREKIAAALAALS